MRGDKNAPVLVVGQIPSLQFPRDIKWQKLPAIRIPMLRAMTDDVGRQPVVV